MRAGSDSKLPGLAGSAGPLLMGVVNITPDSFSDGGRYLGVAEAIDHGLRLLDEGADWLDIGGESTRPGAAPVNATDEAARVVPVIRGLRRRAPHAVLCVDTSKASVAERALDVGATVVNDVSAMAEPDMAPLCARYDAGVVLMHMRGEPRTMQADTHYGDVVAEVKRLLEQRAAHAVAHGVDPRRIAVDPGVGFGKSFHDNARLIRATPELAALGYPVLIGASRKGFIGALTGVKQASERVHGSVGAALAAATCGASILRVHDVAATRRALTVFRAVLP